MEEEKEIHNKPIRISEEIDEGNIKITEYLDFLRNYKHLRRLRLYQQEMNDKEDKYEIYHIMSHFESRKFIANGRSAEYIYEHRKKILESNNIDIETLSYKDRNTTQLERLELLFFLENGIINIDMMKKYGIAFTYVRLLEDKWNIDHNVPGLYIIENLCVYNYSENIKAADLSYAIYANNEMSIGTDTSTIMYFISKNYRKKLPVVNQRIMITDMPRYEMIFENPKDVHVDTEFCKVNSTLGYYKASPERQICELARKINNNYKNLTDICESTEIYQIWRIIKRIRGKRIDEDHLYEVARDLKIEDYVFDIYTFVKNYLSEPGFLKKRDEKIRKEREKEEKELKELKSKEKEEKEKNEEIEENNS